MLFEDLLLKNFIRCWAYSLIRVDAGSEDFVNSIKFLKIGHLDIFLSILNLLLIIFLILITYIWSKAVNHIDNLYMV